MRFALRYGKFCDNPDAPQAKYVGYRALGTLVRGIGIIKGLNPSIVQDASHANQNQTRSLNNGQSANVACSANADAKCVTSTASLQIRPQFVISSRSRDTTGNLLALPAMFPDQLAPAVRVNEGDRELIMMTSGSLPKARRQQVFYADLSQLRSRLVGDDDTFQHRITSQHDRSGKQFARCRQSVRARGIQVGEIGSFFIGGCRAVRAPNVQIVPRQD